MSPKKTSALKGPVVVECIQKNDLKWSVLGAEKRLPHLHPTPAEERMNANGKMTFKTIFFLIEKLLVSKAVR